MFFFFPSLIFAREAAWSSCFLDASDYFFSSSPYISGFSDSLRAALLLAKGDEGSGLLSSLPALEMLSQGWGYLLFSCTLQCLELRIAALAGGREEEEKLITLLGVKKSLVM